MDQLPLPPRRASVNATLVRGIHVSFDERGHELADLAVEIIGVSGARRQQFHRPASSYVASVRGRDGGSMAKEGSLLKEHRLQTIPVTT